MPSHYGFIQFPPGPEGPVSAAFVKISEDQAGITGAAPCGVCPHVLATHRVAIGDEEPSDAGGFVDVDLVYIPLSDVLDFGKDAEGFPFLFNEAGAWPDADQVEALMGGSDWLQDGEAEEFQSAQGGVATPPAQFPAGAPPGGAGRGDGRGRAKPPTTAASLAAMQDSLAALVTGQHSMLAAQAELGSRVVALESTRPMVAGAGRGSGLFSPDGFQPPPGLASLSGLAGPAPVRPGPPPPKASLLLGAHAALPLDPGSMGGSAPPIINGTPPGRPSNALGRGPSTSSAVASQAAARLHKSPPPAKNGNPELSGLLDAIKQQTALMSRLASQQSSTADPLALLTGDCDVGVEGLGKLPGARGAASMEVLRKTLVASPQSVTARVRANRNFHLRGCSSLESAPGSLTSAYFIKQVPFARAKTAAYLLFGMCEVFDLMENGRWEEAEAQLALLLVAGEQAAMEDWRWPTAWLLTHLPEPPHHLLIESPGSAMARPISKLADPSWIAAAIAYTKDMAVIQEASRRRASDDQDKKPKGKFNKSQVPSQEPAGPKS